jgi:Holliday junction resolvasome RuvABC DNA-binding subunit
VTAGKATVGLYVATLGLVTDVLTFLGSVVRLAAAGLQALTDGLQTRTYARATAPTTIGDPPITSALTNLGFKTSEVRRFVATLGSRAETERLEVLVREGLRAIVKS